MGYQSCSQLHYDKPSHTLPYIKAETCYICCHLLKHLSCQMQLQEEAQSKVLKAFKAALRYMDEQTLQSHMAMHLQLQPSTKEEDVDAQGASTSLQAPQALSCPRKPRSRRCPRPASAASLGLPREPSVSRPVSAPAQRSGQPCPLVVATCCCL